VEAVPHGILSCVDRQGEVEGGEQETTGWTHLSTMQSRQSRDVVPALSPSCLLSALLRHDGRLH